MKNTSFKVLGLTVASLLVMGSNTITAQETAAVCKPHAFTIGVTGGTNMSMLYSGNLEINKNYDFGVGYNVGITGSYSFTSMWSAVTEVSFTKQNSERKDMQPILLNSPLQNGLYPLFANFKKTESIDYIDVPVMARVTFGDKLKWYLNAGPSIGFIASSRMLTSGRSMLYTDLGGLRPEGASTTMYSFEGNQNNTDNFTSVAFGVTGGGGLGYAFGKHFVGIDARYEIGLTNVRANTRVNGNNNLQFVTLGIAYNYELFK